MKIYNTNDATGAAPGGSNDINSDYVTNKSLKSGLLKASSYLVALNANPVTTRPLEGKKGKKFYKDEHEARIFILIAIHFLSENSTDFQLPAIYSLRTENIAKDANREVFKKVVKEYQNYLINVANVTEGITENGVVNWHTLKAIDNALPADMLVTFKDGNDEEFDIIAEVADNHELIVQTYDTVNQDYIYNIKYPSITPGADDIICTITSPHPLSFDRIVNNIGNVSTDTLYLNNREVEKIVNDQISDIDLSDADTSSPIIRLDGPIVESIEVDHFDNKYNSRQYKLYKIKPGDTIESILKDHFYYDENDPSKNDDLYIKDPYNPANTVFKFPKRKELDVSLRAYDIRREFYMNFLYYSNVKFVEGVNGEEIIETGIKADTVGGDFNRYSDDVLENFFIFDNEYDPSITPSSSNATVEPNYLKFIKTTPNDSVSSGTRRITYDVNGNTNAFDLEVGTVIRIPTRQTADTLFYHLNFRHDVMLEDLGGVNETRLEYVESSSSNWAGFLETVDDFFSPVSEFVKTEFKELYEETLEFFTSIYNFAIQAVKEIWPRGLGGYVGVDLDVTWGYPIKTEVKAKRSISRLMTKDDDMTLVIADEVEMALSASASLGNTTKNSSAYLGNGELKKEPARFGWGGSISAGLRAKANVLYKFPIRPNETGFLAAVFTAIQVVPFFSVGIGKLYVDATMELLEGMNIMNIRPQNYINNLGFGLAFEAKASASFGGVKPVGEIIDSEGESTGEFYYEPNDSNSPIASEKALDANNIMNYLSPFVNGEASFSLGYGVSYKTSYDDASSVPSKNARQPKALEVENSIGVKIGLKLSGLDGLRRMLSIFFQGEIGKFLASPGLDFSRQLTFGLVHKIERVEEKQLLDASQINILSFSPLPDGSDNLNAIPPEETEADGVTPSSDIKVGAWTKQVKIGAASGNSEVAFLLGSKKIHDLIQAGLNEDQFTMPLLWGLLENIDFKYRLGINNGRTTKFFDDIINKEHDEDVKTLLVLFKEFIEFVKEKLTVRSRSIDLLGFVNAGVDIPYNVGVNIGTSIDANCIAIYAQHQMKRMKLIELLGNNNNEIEEFRIKYEKEAASHVCSYDGTKTAGEFHDFVIDKLDQLVDDELSQYQSQGLLTITADYLVQFWQMISLAFDMLDYLNKIPNTLANNDFIESGYNEIDGLASLIQAGDGFDIDKLMMFLAIQNDLVKPNISFDLLVGFRLAAGLNSPINIKGNIGIDAGLTYVIDLYEKGNILALDDDDSFKPAFDKIAKYVEDPTNGVHFWMIKNKLI